MTEKRYYRRGKIICSIYDVILLIAVKELLGGGLKND